MQRSVANKQPGLFDVESHHPTGFAYSEGMISRHEEQALVAQFATLPFRPFEFHGYLGKRRIVSYGWGYDYAAQTLRESEAIPDFLLPLRNKAAAFAAVSAASLQQILVTEYAESAGIGWHRDKPMFKDIIAVSFLSPCVLRFRRKRGDAWERLSIRVEPRSAYLLRGPSRSEWQHSVPPLSGLRYSVTFRNFVQR